MKYSTEDPERIAALCGMIWFVCIMDACFTWMLPWTMRYIIGAPFVVYSTILLNQSHKLNVTKEKRQAIFLLILLVLLQTLDYRFNAILCYGPLALILLWDEQTLLRLYFHFKRFIVFYAFISIFVEVLVMTDTWRYLPYIDLPPQDVVQENNNAVNHFFGLFVIPEYGTSFLSFYRAMGPLREGGHFAIFLGYVYFVEKCVFGRRHYLIILSGLLTISPNFVIFYLLSEGYVALSHKKVFKFATQIVVLVLSVVLVVLLLPAFLQEALLQVVLERSFIESSENIQSDGLMAIFTDRTDPGGEQMYERFVKRSGLIYKLKGISIEKDDFVLSDFRTLLIHYGYIGMILFVGITYYISRMCKNRFYGLCLFLTGVVVMMFRGWMLIQSYIWVMMMLASVAYYTNIKNITKKK